MPPTKIRIFRPSSQQFQKGIYHFNLQYNRHMGHTSYNIEITADKSGVQRVEKEEHLGFLEFQIDRKGHVLERKDVNRAFNRKRHGNSFQVEDVNCLAEFL